MSRLFRPRLRVYLGLLALIGALLTVPATAAWASVRVLTENFEGSSASTWIFNGNPYCRYCGYVDDDYISAHSGTKSAFIRAYTPLGSFYSVGKRVHLPITHGCTFGMYLSNVGLANIEVINPSGWTYLGLLSLPVGSDYQYRSVTWYGGPSDVYVRVSTVSTSNWQDPWANVDDITVDCW
jgi:hypothetical protein